MRRGFSVLILCGAADALIRTAVASYSTRPAAVCLRRPVCPIRLCDAASPEEPPATLLGGKPLLEGDMLVHKDEESTAWWRAVAREVIGKRVHVSFRTSLRSVGSQPLIEALMNLLVGKIGAAGTRALTEAPRAIE